MPLIESRVMDDPSNNLLKNQFINHGNTFSNSNIAIKSRLEQSFIFDQQNAQQFQLIQNKTFQLRQKQKKYKAFYLKFKKYLDCKIKQYAQFQKLSNQLLSEKNKQIQLLTIQIQSLKQEKNEYLSLKDEKQIIQLKNQQLQQNNNKLAFEINQIKSSYEKLKIQFEQQGQLLDKGIRINSIYQEPNEVSKSFSQVMDELQQSKRKQSDVLKRAQFQKIEQQQAEKINSCNSLIENLLKTIKNTQSKQGQNQDKIQLNTSQKFLTLTDQLLNKSQQLSKTIVNSYKLQKQLQQKEYLMKNLQQKFQKIQKQYYSKSNELSNFLKIQHEQKVNKIKSLQKLQAQLQNIFQKKGLKEHSYIYDAFKQTTKQLFQKLTNNINNNNEKMYEKICQIIQSNIIRLNQYFRTKAQKDIESLHKMMGYMKNAGQIIQKTQQQYQADKQLDNVSSPQRFSFNQASKKQGSVSSASSFRKSIVLQLDLQNAVSEQYDKIKEQILHNNLSALKQSKLVTQGKQSLQSSGVKNQMFAQQQISELANSSRTYTQKLNDYQKNQQTTKIKGKLKKRKN